MTFGGDKTSHRLVLVTVGNPPNKTNKHAITSCRGTGGERNFPEYLRSEMAILLSVSKQNVFKGGSHRRALKKENSAHSTGKHHHLPRPIFLLLEDILFPLSSHLVV